MERFTIHFGERHLTAYIPANLQECSVLPRLLLCESRPVITVVGHISAVSSGYRQACQVLLQQCVFPMAQRHSAVLLSRGFCLDNPEADLAWVVDQVAVGFPQVQLIGVDVDCLAALPEKVTAEPWRTHAFLEHYHAYVLALGANSREACACRTELASAITRANGSTQPGVVLVFGGLAMTWFDVLGGIKEGRHVIAITDDLDNVGVNAAIAKLLSDKRPPRTPMLDLNKRLEEETADMVASGRLHISPVQEIQLLSDLLATLLSKESISQRPHA